MRVNCLSQFLLLLAFLFSATARGDQILDGILCNDHGWPILNARGDAIQYGVELLTSGNSETATWLHPGMEEKGWAGIASKVTDIKATAARQPEFFLPDDPGPRYPGVDQWFRFDAVLLARDKQEPTGSTLSTVDLHEYTLSKIKDNAALIASLTKYATTFNLLKTACGSTPLYKYVGRCNTPDLTALIDANASAADARLQDVYDFWQSEGVDVMIVDAATPVGGNTLINPYPYLTDRTGVIDQFFEVQGRAWRTDPSRMAIAIEAWPFSDTGTDPQTTNATTGPRAGERWGFPTAILIQSRANNGAYKANGEVWDEFYAPANEHLWLMLCPHSSGKWAVTPNEAGAALVRNAAQHNVSAVAIAHTLYVSVSQFLPPAGTPNNPWSPSRRPHQSPPSN